MGISKQENRMRDLLSNEYDQPFGTTDQEIAKALGIRGRVADFVGRNRTSGDWIIAESKGDDMYKAIAQLQNTVRALQGQGSSARIASLRIYSSRLAELEARTQSWAVKDGFLGYFDEAGTFIRHTIDGIPIEVLVAP